MQEILNIWCNYSSIILSKVPIILGKVVDFFYRVEFQQRGSPHIHGPFWLENTPECGKDSDDDVAKFVDGYASCQADSEELTDLVNLQRHRHSKTCKKGSQCL